MSPTTRRARSLMLDLTNLIHDLGTDYPNLNEPELDVVEQHYRELYKIIKK